MQGQGAGTAAKKLALCAAALQGTSHRGQSVNAAAEQLTGKLARLTSAQFRMVRLPTPLFRPR